MECIVRDDAALTPHNPVVLTRQAWSMHSKLLQSIFQAPETEGLPRNCPFGHSPVIMQLFSDAGEGKL